MSALGEVVGPLEWQATLKAHVVLPVFPYLPILYEVNERVSSGVGVLHTVFMASYFDAFREAGK